MKAIKLTLFSAFVFSFTQPSLWCDAPKHIEPSSDATRSVDQSYPIESDIVTTKNVINIQKNLNAASNRELEEILKFARRLRSEGDSTQAITLLVALIKSNPSDSIKRPALLDLALSNWDQGNLAKTQQILSQFIQLYPEDASIPEVLLWQGLVYREMGASNMALAKFYAVMTTAINMQRDEIKRYQDLVLVAQTEIADTHYLQGNYEEARRFYERLLKQDDSVLNKQFVQYKLIRCFSSTENHDQVVFAAKKFLETSPVSLEQAEVRFLLASSLIKLKRYSESTEQVYLLLRSRRAFASENPTAWSYWQRKAGNEIANQLYNAGDYVHALDIYLSITELDQSPPWQIPILYQSGLVYEHLGQPTRAKEIYSRIMTQADKLESSPDLALQTVLDMTKWRVDHLVWQIQAQVASQTAPSSHSAGEMENKIH